MSRESLLLRLSIRQAILGCAGVAGLISPTAYAQEATAASAEPRRRGSRRGGGHRLPCLAAERDQCQTRIHVGFSDSVFAEDIGKFPDLNIAESLNRIPGIQLVARSERRRPQRRDPRPQHQLHQDHVLNGSQIGVASTWSRRFGQSQNREVDLDLFPTELFTRLDVNKTPKASELEGGARARSTCARARPFDNPGTHFNYQLQANYGEEQRLLQSAWRAHRELVQRNRRRPHRLRICRQQVFDRRALKPSDRATPDCPRCNVTALRRHPATPSAATTSAAGHDPDGCRQRPR